MFKKTLALLLAALMICSLAACGNSSSQEESNTQSESTAEQTENVDTQEQVDASETEGTSAVMK